MPINDQVLEVASELAALRVQMDLRQSECMGAQGFPFFARSAQEHLASLVELYSVSIASLALEDAKVKGYGALRTSSPTSAKEQEYFESLSQSESGAYGAAQRGGLDEMRDISTPSGSRLSIPVGGCLGQAAKTVYGSIDSYVNGVTVFEELQGLMGAISVAVEETDEFKDGLAKWVKCMGKDGFRYKSPSEARGAASEARGAALKTRKDQEDGSITSTSTPTSTTQTSVVNPITAEERRIAVADATCQEETSLSQVVTHAALIQQSQLTSEREKTFVVWRELMGRIAREGYGGVEADSKGLSPQGAGGS